MRFLYLLIILFFLTFAGCSDPQIIGKWKREFGPELEKEFGPKTNSVGDLTLNADSTYLIAGDGHPDTSISYVPGWHTGHDQKGRWRLHGEKLFLEYANIEPRVYIAYSIIQLTQEKLILLSPGDKEDSTNYMVYSRID